jgi:lipopolysaccharide assembly outer membrane protein LptD (OstA)
MVGLVLKIKKRAMLHDNVSIRRLFSCKTHMNIQQRILSNHDNIQGVPYSILNMRKTASNLFVSFIVNNKVLFNSSAGSAGIKRKERRRDSAVYALASSFNKFVRYYVSTHVNLSLFRNIVVHINAPVKLVRLFMRIVRSYIRNMAINHNKEVILQSLLRRKRQKSLAVYDTDLLLQTYSNLLHSNSLSFYGSSSKHSRLLYRYYTEYVIHNTTVSCVINNIVHNDCSKVSMLTLRVSRVHT